MSKIECDILIKEIYKSFGRCKTCKGYNTALGATPNDGHCKILRDSSQALWTNIEVDDNWYCADYEKE
jgi:hypothetical protein